MALATLLAAPFAFGRPPEVADVLLLGDSLAGQLGWRFAKEATARGKRFLYSFRPGSSTKQWLHHDWFEQKIKQHPAKCVLVSLGVNCTRSERPKLAHHIRILYTLVPKATSVVWLLPPPLKQSTKYLTDAVEKVREGRDLVVFSPGALPLESDGIHPTDAGHKQWAKLLAERIWGPR